MLHQSEGCIFEISLTAERLEYLPLSCSSASNEGNGFLSNQEAGQQDMMRPLAA